MHSTGTTSDTGAGTIITAASSRVVRGLMRKSIDVLQKLGYEPSSSWIVSAPLPS